MAKAHGRNVTDQIDFLTDHAARDLGWKLYDLQPAPIQDLYDRLAKIEAELAELRSETDRGYERLVQAFDMLVELSQAFRLLKD
jgi:hypothetical protein